MIALDWLGYDATAIEIDHHERHAGESGYTLKRLLRVALDGMFFRTTFLLRVVVLLGFLVALIGIVVAGFEIVDYFAENDKAVPGYTSLAVLLLVLAGFIIVSVGVVGLYVGRIFEQVKNRPLFLIDAEASDRDWRRRHDSGSDASPGSAASRRPLRRARRPSRDRPELRTTADEAAVAVHQPVECFLGEPSGMSADPRVGGAPAE